MAETDGIKKTVIAIAGLSSIIVLFSFGYFLLLGIIIIFIVVGLIILTNK